MNNINSGKCSICGNRIDVNDENRLPINVNTGSPGMDSSFVVCSSCNKNIILKTVAELGMKLDMEDGHCCMCGEEIRYNSDILSEHPFHLKLHNRLEEEGEHIYLICCRCRDKFQSTMIRNTKAMGRLDKEVVDEVN